MQVMDIAIAMAVNPELSMNQSAKYEKVTA
jgi:hypothetical protein